MSDQFIGEIRAFAFSFPPVDWAYCNGQQVNVLQYQALFSLIAGKYGATDMRTYFTLPDLIGRAVMHPGTQPNPPTYTLAQTTGTTAVTLTPAQTPVHSHGAQSANTGTILTNTPSATVYPSVPRSGSTTYDAWSTEAGTASVSFPPNALAYAGGGSNGLAMPHSNISPCLALGFCIALNGTYPVAN